MSPFPKFLFYNLQRFGGMILEYIDFVDLEYEPGDDLICDFYVEPQGISIKEAAGGVAAESSIGTWTELTTMKPYVEALRARVFKIEGNNIRIAYPVELFEPGNAPNILSSVAGNVFGLSALKNLRLNDIQFPPELLKGFKGPKYGISGIRKILKVPKRPLCGTIIKPKLGLGTADHAEVAYEAWSGGCDIVKDDENLSSQRFSPFEDRLVKTLKARDRAEEETGERKVYMINITSETNEMLKRAQFVEDHGGEYAMVDILTCGFSALQTLRNFDLNLVLHGHRAGHAAFTKDKKHGISMLVIAKVARLIGVDQLHIGTFGVGKMRGSPEEDLKYQKALTEKFGGLKQVFPVASGGLHPGLVEPLLKIAGPDIIVQAGGGIHGHPKGTKSGAIAVRQAIDAAMKNISLTEYANTHKELREAISKWGRIS